MRSTRVVLIAILFICLPGPSHAGTQQPAAADSDDGIANGSRERINGAVAGALIATLTEQFDGRTISLLLDKVDIQPSSIRDRLVSGEGKLTIGTDDDWIGFRFNTLYDIDLASAAYPEITLGGITHDERELPNDTDLVHQLDDRITERLAEEFSTQPVRLQLDHIRTVQAGKRYVRMTADGIADFGRDGTSPAQIEGLYDYQDNTWLRVNYALGPAPDAEPQAAVAGR